jgi:hypothetical protein
MSTIELEAKKAELARVILSENNEDVLQNMMYFLKNSGVSRQSEKTHQEKRKKLDEALDRYPIDLSGFKFNRDDANDYE